MEALDLQVLRDAAAWFAAGHGVGLVTVVQTWGSAPRPPGALLALRDDGVAKRFRHAAIFGALDSLQPGETMRFANDHDPLPLLAQLAQRYGEGVAIEYRHREPGMIVIDFSVR